VSLRPDRRSPPACVAVIPQHHEAGIDAALRNALYTIMCINGRRQVTAVVADEQTLVLQGLCSLLQQRLPEISIVGTASSVDEMDRSVRKLAPDLLFTEVLMSGIMCLPALEHALTSTHRTRIIVVSAWSDAVTAERCVQAGAHAFVPKTSSAEELVSAVRTILDGGLFVATSGEPRDARIDCLSQRERRVLGLIALGYTNAQIARKLYLSLRTIESQRAAIRTKLGIYSRAELTAIARATNLNTRRPIDWRPANQAQDTGPRPSRREVKWQGTWTSGNSSRAV
jgi:two-component system response regulator NreC